MAAGGHLGFSVFHCISETVGRRAKPMKIWARRGKGKVGWCKCGALKWLTLGECYPRWRPAAILDFPFSTVSRKRLVVERNRWKFGPPGVKVRLVWCNHGEDANTRMLSKMAAGGHLGFSVFHCISETVGRRAKPMKIWAPRGKGKVGMVLLWCLTNTRMLSKMAAGGHLGFSVFHFISETVGRRAKPMKIWAHRGKGKVGMV